MDRHAKESNLVIKKKKKNKGDGNGKLNEHEELVDSTSEIALSESLMFGGNDDNSSTVMSSIVEENNGIIMSNESITNLIQGRKTILQERKNDVVKDADLMSKCPYNRDHILRIWRTPRHFLKVMSAVVSNF